MFCNRISFATAVSAIVTLAVAGCGSSSKDASPPTSSQQTNDTTVTKTIKVDLEGTVDDPANRLFVVTYFYSAQLGPKELGEAMTATFGEGKEPPESMVMGIAGLCGPTGYAEKVNAATGFPVKPVNDKPCTDDGAPFTVALDLAAGTTLHYSVDTGLSDIDNTETFAGNYVGDPSDPPTAEDFEIVKTDDSATYTYRFNAAN